MNPKMVKAKHKRITDKIDGLYLDLRNLQEECPHPNLTVSHGANTGNYDPSSDCYWKDYKCPDCGKMWTVYSD